MTIIYLPLESYQERYTFQLKHWVETRFKERNVSYVIVEGKNLRHDESIKTGQVLDAYGRPYYALTQMANLVSFLDSGAFSSSDVIFSEDMFQPGYEAFPYIMEQIPKNKRPKFFTRCLAQSIDPDDFVFPWRRWMRPFEQIVDETIDGVLIASTEMGWHYRIGMLNKAPLYVTGLPFDKNEVRSRIEYSRPIYSRPIDVCFSSRFDEEKQPWFFLNIVEKLSDVKFAILTGSKELKSNNQDYVDRAKELASRKNTNLTIHSNLSKNDYYRLLADSKVQFNCARQDWVSNTLNEASALKTMSLCPAFRSFPEALNNNAQFLYTPWSEEDAIEKLEKLLLLDSLPISVDYPADTQHMSIDKTIDILLGIGESYRYKDR